MTYLLKDTKKCDNDLIKNISTYITKKNIKYTIGGN